MENRNSSATTSAPALTKIPSLMSLQGLEQSSPFSQVELLPGRYPRQPPTVPPLFPGMNYPCKTKPPPHIPTDKTKISENPEFTQISKALYRTVQARRQLEHWKIPPRFIRKSLDRLSSQIKPPQPTKALQNDIDTILKDAGCKIQETIMKHLRDRLTTNRNILARTKQLHNQSDLSTIEDIVLHQILKMTAGKVQESKILRLIKEEISHLGESCVRSGYQPSASCSMIEVEFSETARPGTSRLDHGEERTLIPFRLTSSFSRPRTGIRTLLPKASCLKQEGKKWDIVLDSSARNLIVTDSNFRLVDSKDLPFGWQLAILPGAKLEHIPDIINKLPCNKLQNIFISVGINNRTHPPLAGEHDVYQQISYNVRKRSGAGFFVGVSVSSFLHHNLKDNVHHINCNFSNTPGMHYISPLDQMETTTKHRYDIHHDKRTTGRILHSILSACQH